MCRTLATNVTSSTETVSLSIMIISVILSYQCQKQFLFSLKTQKRVRLRGNCFCAWAEAHQCTEGHQTMETV